MILDDEIVDRVHLLVDHLPLPVPVDLMLGGASLVLSGDPQLEPVEFGLHLPRPLGVDRLPPDGLGLSLRSHDVKQQQPVPQLLQFQQVGLVVGQGKLRLITVPSQEPLQGRQIISFLTPGFDEMPHLVVLARDNGGRRWSRQEGGGYQVGVVHLRSGEQLANLPQRNLGLERYLGLRENGVLP